MEKLVSVVMPTYNCGNFIIESINSVINQSYLNWELLIIDDCSSDNTELKVDKTIKLDARIKYLKLDKNSGPAVARNKGIEEAKGSYIAFLDSDDLWSANKLEKQIQFMEDNSYNFTCTDYSQIDEVGNQLNKVIMSKKKVDYNGVLLTCPIGNSTVIYSVENLGKIYVPNIRKRNDDALWLQVLKREKYCYGLKEVLMKYRIRNNSVSSNKFDLIKYHWYLYREIEKLSIVRSVFHICFWVFIKIIKIK